MRREHYVVFGAGKFPNKGVLGLKSRRMSGYELRILELANDGQYGYGDDFDIEDADGQYTTLYFTKRESLQSFIKSCEQLLSMWDNEDSSVSS